MGNPEASSGEQEFCNFASCDARTQFYSGQLAYDMSSVDFMLVGPRLLISLGSYRQQSTAVRQEADLGRGGGTSE